MENAYASDVEAILAHRYDQGADFWATPDRRLLKGAPFIALESAMYLLELGVPAGHEALCGVAKLIFDGWRPDGRIKVTPSGAIYPCQTALAVNVLCAMGLADDERVRATLGCFLSAQEEDGGWKCSKYSFGRGEETAYSTPYTTLVALDAFRRAGDFGGDERLDRAVAFLLEHWTIRRPISPCHYGIGSRFMQIEYPFRGYGLFYYVYVLSFYRRARKDARFAEALAALEAKAVEGGLRVERVVPKLAALRFCQKGQVSELASRRYRELLANLTL